MSNDMQKAILDAIAGAVPAGLEFRRNSEHANTGRVYVQRGFTTVLMLAYDFQSDNASIQPAGGNGVNGVLAELPEHLAVELRRSAVRPSDEFPWLAWSFRYTEGDRIERMIAGIEHLIRTRDVPPNKGKVGMYRVELLDADGEVIEQHEVTTPAAAEDIVHSMGSEAIAHDDERYEGNGSFQAGAIRWYQLD